MLTTITHIVEAVTFLIFAGGIVALGGIAVVCSVRPDR